MAERRASRGFTLLEVMLAMSVLALMAAICYAAFHLGIRAVQRGEVAVASAQRLRVASDVLIRQIKSIVQYCARDKDDEIFAHFQGTGTSMTFITTAGIQGQGLTRVVYRLEEGPRLVMEESRHFSADRLGREASDKRGEHSTVLLDGFRSLTFRYCFNDAGEAGCEWRATFDSRPTAEEENMMAVAVGIDVEGMPGLEGDWHTEIPLMALTRGDDRGECDDVPGAVGANDGANDDAGAGPDDESEDGGPDDEGGDDEGDD